jgi:hypothetical protein
MRVRWFPGSPVTPSGAAGESRAAIAAPAGEVAVHPSRHGGEPHKVGVRGGHWACTCKAYRKGGHECWAIKLEKERHAVPG